MTLNKNNYLLGFLMISCIVVNSSLAKNLKINKSSEQNDLSVCTNVKVVSESRTKIQADCPNSTNSIVTSEIDLATCFYDNGGQIKYLPRTEEISSYYYWSIDTECEHLYVLVDKVTVYYKTDGKTKSKVVEKDNPYYLNGFCYKYRGLYQTRDRKQGWSYINIYEYVFYNDDGELYC